MKAFPQCMHTQSMTAPRGRLQRYIRIQVCEPDSPMGAKGHELPTADPAWSLHCLPADSRAGQARHATAEQGKRLA